MKEKELILPDDWEVKEVVGNKIILKEKEKELPKTWKECAIVINNVDTVNIDSKINSFDIDDLNGQIGEDDYKLLPEGLGKPMLAICQLLICRNAWWKVLGWKPDWENGFNDKYFIGNYRGIIDKDCAKTWNRILAFPTPEVRDQFLDSFRDLIKEAKELL